jgi:carbon storage regulator
MLLLCRRTGEAVIIGNDVKVVVLGIKRGQVRIGIEAPRSVTVDREEIYMRRRRDGSPEDQGSCS